LDILSNLRRLSGKKARQNEMNVILSWRMSISD
jgi:hypothetical protein